MVWFALSQNEEPSSTETDAGVGADAGGVSLEANVEGEGGMASAESGSASTPDSNSPNDIREAPELLERTHLEGGDSDHEGRIAPSQQALEGCGGAADGRQSFQDPNFGFEAETSDHDDITEEAKRLVRGPCLVGLCLYCVGARS